MSRRFVASACCSSSSSARERPWRPRSTPRSRSPRRRRRASPSPWRWSPSPRRAARTTALGDRRRHRARHPLDHPAQRARGDGAPGGARPRAIVEAGTVLVALDVSVERAELQAQKARPPWPRPCSSATSRRAPDTPSPTWRWTAPAPSGRRPGEVARTEAIIARKTIPPLPRPASAWRTCRPVPTRGPCSPPCRGSTTSPTWTSRCRSESPPACAPGTAWRSPRATAPLRRGRWSPWTPGGSTARNATVRAASRTRTAPPGASVRVAVPDGPGGTAVAIPVSALRKGPDGDHVFVVSAARTRSPAPTSAPWRAAPCSGTRC